MALKKVVIFLYRNVVLLPIQAELQIPAHMVLPVHQDILDESYVTPFIWSIFSANNRSFSVANVTKNLIIFSGRLRRPDF